MFDMRHQDAMSHYHHSRPPLPPVPASVSAPVAARAEQNIIRDQNLGMLRTVTIIDTDFTQLGIPTGEPAASGRQWHDMPAQPPYGGLYMTRGPQMEYQYQFPSEQAEPSQYYSRGYCRGSHRHRQQTWRYQAPPPPTPGVDPAQLWGSSTPQVQGGDQPVLPQPSQTWGISATSPSDPAPLTSASAPTSVRPPIATLAPTSPSMPPPSTPTEPSATASLPENPSALLPSAQQSPN